MKGNFPDREAKFQSLQWYRWRKTKHSCPMNSLPVIWASYEIMACTDCRFIYMYIFASTHFWLYVGHITIRVHMNWVQAVLSLLTRSFIAMLNSSSIWDMEITNQASHMYTLFSIFNMKEVHGALIQEYYFILISKCMHLLTPW